MPPPGAPAVAPAGPCRRFPRRPLLLPGIPFMSLQFLPLR